MFSRSEDSPGAQHVPRFIKTQRLIIKKYLIFRRKYKFPCNLITQAGFTEEGKLNGIKVDFYSDMGYNDADSSLDDISNFIDSCKSALSTCLLIVC